MPSDDETTVQLPAIGRRRLLAGGAGIAAAVVLAGCGNDSEPAADSTSEPPADPPEPSQDGSPEPSEGDPQAPSEGGGTELGDASAVAVGGGAIFAAQRVVVTQPTEGNFRAFDITCTHAGCPVSEVTDTILCTCHGSTFALEDGSVVSGPATEPLGTKNVTVADGTITLA